ncbi:MAG: ATP-binding protein [Cyclobacteriaceae bacterium]
MIKLDNRINNINSLIFDIAAGNFKSKGNIKGEMDELDAVITGINMLSEELEKNTVSKNNLKKIFDGIPDMVFILNFNGLILDQNNKVNTSAGYTLEMLKGNTFNVLFPLKHKFNFSELKEFLKTHQKFENLTTQMITADRSLLSVSCSFALVEGNTPEDNMILMIVKDLSEVQLVKKELEERNKELNTFIYRASHDLQGPLATMTGIFNLVDLEEDNPETVKMYLNLLKDSSNKLHDVIEDLLDLGRITASGINYQNIKIIDIVNSIIEENKNSISFQKATIKIINTQDYLIKSEPQIIKSVLYNLFDNSIKYCNHHLTPKIKIEIMDSIRGVKINFSDNGIGISNEIRGKIFNMFYRGNASSKGSGLGLYIVKTGVEKLGGKIWLRSSSEKGSTFSIYLPHGNTHLI